MGKVRDERSAILAAASGLIGLNWSSKASLRIFAITTVLMLVVWLTAAGAIMHGHSIAVREATETSQTLALIATTFTSKSIAATDLILKSMLDWIADENIETVDQFEMTFGERRYFDKLRERIVNVDQIDVATFISSSGRIVLFTRSYPPPPINVADRDYFKAQSVNGAPSTSLGNAVQNRGNGRWTFYLAKQVTAPSGAILGVVIVGIESDYLAEFYRRITQGGETTLSFWRDDGTVLAVNRSTEGLLGKQFPQAESLKILSQTPEGGTEYVTSRRLLGNPADRMRVLTARPVPNVPGYVVASIGMNKALASWHTERNAISGIAALLTFVIGIASLQLQRSQRESDRRRTDELEQNILRAIVDMPLALTAIFDRHGRVLRSNDSFDRFIQSSGRPRGFMVGDIPEAEEITRFIHGDSEFAEAEVRLVRPPFGQQVVRFSMAKQDLQDLGRCSIIVGIDESAQRAAQVAIAQSAKLITLGEMATGMAHELNQPINIIHMAAQNALFEIQPMEPDDPPPIPTPEMLVFLASKFNTILSQTARAASLISHMQVFGRAPKEVVAPFDAREVCTDALNLIGQQIRTRGIAIDVDAGPNPAMILGHRTMLEQVLINVVLNARDALSTIAEGEKRIEIRCRTDDRTVVVEVEDNGPGIPESIRDRIFDPFFTTKDVGQGTGLGLAISYGIVSDMKGSIRVAPSDVGARIRIELPAAG